ncbi:hypothetical protein HAALTHF_05450n [Vreelandella aquamarina]|nr:hypothetical protein HAALTHF_05450n [Halomonas axialensis]
MAVYGGIQAHEVERWLNALTNAAYDRRCPLTKVHGATPVLALPARICFTWRPRFEAANAVATPWPMASAVGASTI